MFLMYDQANLTIVGLEPRQEVANQSSANKVKAAEEHSQHFLLFQLILDVATS